MRLRWIQLSCLIIGLELGSAGAAPSSSPELALHVLNRIANGPKPGEVERVAAMGVSAYIDSQLAADASAYPPVLAARLAALDVPNRPAGAVLAQFIELRKDVRDEEEGARARRQQGLAAISLQTAQARLLRAIDSPRQLDEVMVDFWFNHFNVFADKGETRALVASYERDAIRPHITGKFRDLLGATAKHPAMLYYLDNHLSAAPRPGAARRAGLNENYARELMELHTLGAGGGYSQHDVTELARMLTGWTYDRRSASFRFDEKRHDQGVKRWMGRQVAPGGQAEGEYALDVLANHPATARHVSLRLAQYFVHDTPPPALVARMAATWLDTGGDIRAVLRTLLSGPEFLAPAAIGAKFKTPYQFVVSAVRASAAPGEQLTPLLNAMRQLGMPLYGCQTPDGYKNTEAAWLNPDGLSRRISFAAALAEGRLQLGESPMPALDPAQLDATFSPALTRATRAVVADSPARLRAALLLGSPDFMLR